MGKSKKRRPGAGGGARSWILHGEPGAAASGRFLPWIAPLLLFVLVISWSNIRSLDIWWHLATGKWILDNGGIPHVDPFSFTAGGREWISHEWLFGLAAYALERLGGIPGITAARALLLAVLFGLAAWTARARGAAPGMTLLVLAACHPMARYRFTERPELVSVPLALGFLLAHEKSRTHPRILLVLPVLSMVWANVHGGTALLGWGLAGALLLERAWELRCPDRSPPQALLSKDLGMHWLAFSGVVLGSLVNPHHARALFYGLLRTESPLDNKEFQSLFELAAQGVDLSIVLFVAWAVVLGMMFLLRPGSVRVSEWLLFPALLLLTVTFFRFRILFAFLLAPSFAFHLTRSPSLARLRSWVPALLAAAILIHSAQLESRGYFYRFGAAMHSGIFPEGGIRFIRESDLSGNMFNTYGLGGYLIWNLWPERKVFIDGREDVYLGPGILEEYLRCFDSPERWRALVEKHRIEFAVVRYPEQPPQSPERSLDQLAFPREEWGLVYFDDMMTLYVRRNGGNDAVLRRSEIREVQPLQLSGYLDDVLRDPEQSARFLGEMRAAMERNPGSFRNHFLLGILALKRGPEHLNEAIGQFSRTVELNSEFAPAWLNLGSIYIQMGRNREAREAFEKALSLEKSGYAEMQLRRLRSLPR